MRGPAPNTGASRGSLREVYVARTVREPQPNFEKFLNTFGRRLGLTAVINTIASTHLTFLESSGLAGHFRTRGFSEKDIRQFRGELEQHLGDSLDTDYATVYVDEKRPLRFMGRTGTLALNIEQDETLSEERNEIERFLTERFGELPDLQEFDPHITLGRITRRLGYREWNDPTRLVPGLQLPEAVTLNGLEAYLGRFQPQTRVSAR